jgi:hypothetical protein
MLADKSFLQDVAHLGSMSLVVDFETIFENRKKKITSKYKEAKYKGEILDNTLRSVHRKRLDCT